MPRFKVKDLIIGQIKVGALLGAPCQANLLTDRECAKPGTVYPCLRNRDPLTEVPCAATSDTNFGCVPDLPEGQETVRPCFIRTTKKEDNKCAKPDGMPNEHKTKFYCMDQAKTDVPCKGGSNTEIPGMPRDPWQGCLQDSKTQKPCAPVPPPETKWECLRNSSTNQPCMQNSNTQRPCASGNLPETRFECRFDTKHACNTAEKPTEFPCEAGGRPVTRVFCRTESTETPRDPKCDPYTIHCQLFTLGGATPFADAGPGAVPCPPLSALAMSDQDPGALEALAALREDLRGVLGIVENRQREVEALLQPRNVKEAEELERTLTRALEETKKLKAQLAARDASGAQPKGKKRKGA